MLVTGSFLLPSLSSSLPLSLSADSRHFDLLLYAMNFTKATSLVGGTEEGKGILNLTSDHSTPPSFR